MYVFAFAYIQTKISKDGQAKDPTVVKLNRIFLALFKLFLSFRLWTEFTNLEIFSKYTKFQIKKRIPEIHLYPYFTAALFRGLPDNL